MNRNRCNTCESRETRNTCNTGETCNCCNPCNCGGNARIFGGIGVFRNNGCCNNGFQLPDFPEMGNCGNRDCDCD